MTFTDITVERDYRSARVGQALEGLRVQFTPTAPMNNAGDTVIPIPVTVDVPEDGQLQVVLAANTDPTTDPAGTGYHVRELLPRGSGGVSRGYTVIIPHDAPGGIVDLSTLDEVNVPELSDFITQDDLDALAVVVASKQPADADLAAFAALAPADDDVVQRKAGAWVARTPEQLAADLSLGGLGDVDTTGAVVGQVVAVSQVSPLKFELVEPFTQLPASNGSDDTATLNAVLAVAGGKRIRGLPGETYRVTAPLILPPGGRIELDMTGCTVKGVLPDTQFNLLRNDAMTPQRSITDGAITSATTTLTAAAAGFTSADVGRYVKVPGAAVGGDLLVARITAVTNATTATVDTAASTTVSGATCAIHNTDYDIYLTGGTWDHLPATGVPWTQDLRDHSINLRFVERFAVTGMTHTSKEGKYAIHIAGAKYGRITGHYFDNCPSDGVHIHGPAHAIDIADLAGVCDDDMFVLTGQESSVYPYDYNDCIGPITQVTGTNIHKLGGLARIVYVSPGRSGELRDIKIRNVSGRSATYGVMVEGDKNARGGMIDDLVIENVDTFSEQGWTQIYFDSVDAGKVTIDGAWREQPGSTNDLIGLSGATIDTLVARNLRMTNSGTGRLLKLAQNSIATLCTVKSLVLGNIRLSMPSAGAAIELFGAHTITELVVENVFAEVTGNSWLLRVPTSGATITATRLRGVRWMNPAGPSGSLVMNVNGVLMPDLWVSDTVTDGAYYLADLGSSTSLYLSNIKVAANSGSFHLSSGAQLILWGSGANFAGTSLAVDAGGTIRSRIGGYAVDISKLNNNFVGDRAYNTNAAVVPSVVGPVIYDGSFWRNAITGSVRTGVITLVAGTATVTDAAITAQSSIRVASKTPGGTPGALFVSAKTAGTGFTISSTSTADTSAVQYDVLSY